MLPNVSGIAAARELAAQKLINKLKVYNMQNSSEKHVSTGGSNTVLPAVRVQWSISATMECPHCEHHNDFMQVDEYWNFSNVGENVEKFHYPIEITCKECGKEFTVDGADY